jgi:aquaporin Z
MMRRLAAEALGTFALVFAGTGAIVVNDVTGGSVTHVGVSLTFGLVVLAMIYAVGDVSRAHLNPAVTLGFFAARRLPGREVAPYVAAQVAGALAASGLLRLLFPTHATLGASLPLAGALPAFGIEFVFTALLVFVVLGVSTPECRPFAGIAVGAVIAFEALAGGPVSGASMNPARSLGPALVAGRFEGLWIYFAAPLSGALAAVGACRLVRSGECCRACASEASR